MEITRSLLFEQLPRDIAIPLWHPVFAPQDNIIRTMLLDDLLLCKGLPAYAHYDNKHDANKAWLNAITHIFNNTNVDISNRYIVDARTLRVQYTHDSRERMRVLIGRTQRR